MKSLEKYVESSLDLQSAEEELMTELNNILHIPRHHIKNICLESRLRGTAYVQIVVVYLLGKNSLRSEDLSKIKNLTVHTPNILEIEYGEIPL